MNSPPNKRARKRPPSVRQELRDIVARLQRIEDELSKSKLAAEESQRTRSKWGERVWDVAKALLTFLLIAGIVYGAQSMQCVPPPPMFNKIEVRP